MRLFHAASISQLFLRQASSKTQRSEGWKIVVKVATDPLPSLLQLAGSFFTALQFSEQRIKRRVGGAGNYTWLLKLNHKNLAAFQIFCPNRHVRMIQ